MLPLCVIKCGAKLESKKLYRVTSQPFPASCLKQPRAWVRLCPLRGQSESDSPIELMCLQTETRQQHEILTVSNTGRFSTGKSLKLDQIMFKTWQTTHANYTGLAESYFSPLQRTNTRVPYDSCAIEPSNAVVAKLHYTKKTHSATCSIWKSRQTWSKRKCWHVGENPRERRRAVKNDFAPSY